MKITTCTCGKDMELRLDGLWYHVTSGTPECNSTAKEASNGL